MELNNEFRVAVPAAKTWEFLTDVERVAPCLPGATLLSVDGDEFKVLSGKKAATFFQLDRRISMMIDVQLTSQLPLVQSQD